MFDSLFERFRQKKRTIAFPSQTVSLPERFRGLPVLDKSRCRELCKQCEQACPTGAVTVNPELSIDLGKCLFCTDCVRVCPTGAIGFTRQYALSVRNREDLHFSGQELKLARAMEKSMLKVFGRSLKLRQVSAAGCNACEADVNVLNTVVFDLGRFGIQFVASPRHADGLLITGPVSQNMELALQKTYDAVPSPKIVIVAGACAISGGPYLDHGEVKNGAAGLLPVDLFIPGCPPHPLTILDGLLRLLGKMDPVKSR